MGTYDKQIATAKRLIAKKGETSTLLRKAEGAASDPDKPWRPAVAAAPTETTCSAAWLDYAQNVVDGTLIKRGDQQVYIPAVDLAGVVPDPSSDVLQRASGEKWKVVSVEVLAPNGEHILYTVQVRK